MDQYQQQHKQQQPQQQYHKHQTRISNVYIPTYCRIHSSSGIFLYVLYIERPPPCVRLICVLFVYPCIFIHVHIYDLGVFIFSLIINVKMPGNVI